MANESKKSKKHKRSKKKKEVEDTSEIDQAEEQEELSNSHHEKHTEEVSHSQTGQPDDDDSDAEDQPKRKKKKKKIFSEETQENKKGKKSIRQMKREKHAQRQAEAQAASKDELKSQCLTYLSQWKHDKQNWKFMKAKQVWLYKNMFSSKLIPSTSWPTLLEYFESAKGNIRKLLLDEANKVIQKMDEWTEAQSGENNKKEEEETEESETVAESTKPDETSYKRARDLIQCLQE